MSERSTDSVLLSSLSCLDNDSVCGFGSSGPLPLFRLVDVELLLLFLRCLDVKLEGPVVLFCTLIRAIVSGWKASAERVTGVVEPVGLEE